VAENVEGAKRKCGGCGDASPLPRVKNMPRPPVLLKRRDAEKVRNPKGVRPSLEMGEVFSG